MNELKAKKLYLTSKKTQLLKVSPKISNFAPTIFGKRIAFSFKIAQS